MNTYTFRLATIHTIFGILEVYWSMDNRSIQYVCGGMLFHRPNGLIRSSLSDLFGCPSANLESRTLVITEGKYITPFPDSHKLSKELLDCEWSDYGMDMMSFQANLAIGEDREEQFQQIILGRLGQEAGEDPIPFLYATG